MIRIVRCNKLHLNCLQTKNHVWKHQAYALSGEKYVLFYVICDYSFMLAINLLQPPLFVLGLAMYKK